MQYQLCGEFRPVCEWRNQPFYRLFLKVATAKEVVSNPECGNTTAMIHGLPRP